MALTPEQLEARKKYLGSSDAAAVLGLDRFRSAWDVWAQKTGRDSGFEGNEATRRGVRFEPMLLDWAEEELGVKLLRDQFFAKPNHPLCANLDALCPNEYLVEAKSSNAVGTDSNGYGDDGSDQVPDRVTIQVHHQFAVTGLRLAYVPVVIPVFGRFDFRMYRIERNDKLADVIAEKGCEFWINHVEADMPPPNPYNDKECRPSIDVMKRIIRQPNKSVPVPDELVNAWLSCIENRLQSEKDCERAQAELLAAMLDADGATCSHGTLTYFETSRKGYTVEPTTYRQLRFKKGK